ncbi:hypothetical protein FOZ62_025384 [Perkinsus olseni]|uniref:RNA-splicing ligase RtcB homolog n=1 Tax=Perkinsus olseni TaxID=32597 RepID=A0A7J6RBG6_PEROL|nr:hypothetical protein FOZ62_025384 [Perkinsus olseni]
MSSSSASPVVRRPFEEDKKFISRMESPRWHIDKGFVENMNVPVKFYANDKIMPAVMEELQRYSVRPAGEAGFLPALKQLGNVASLPGIVGNAIGLPDIHSGYGFAVGSVAAFDASNPQAIVSPGGVGFDINCGVRLLRTNLTLSDVEPVKEQLVQALYDCIPVGVGSEGVVPVNQDTLREALQYGMDWSVREGYSWVEDKYHCEEQGRLLNANASEVSRRAMIRGVPQLGTLGAGNHYAEVQVVDEIYDKYAAKQLGLERQGQVCLMMHSGSRGLGHQVATDALQLMCKAAMTRKNRIHLNDPQLSCAPIHSEEGQLYLRSMAAAANFAWVNRSTITFMARQAFSKVFKQDADDLDMHVVYDISHNTAKLEEHLVDGAVKQLLVHRKGATRAFPPNHPLVASDYQSIGEPVLIGGSMGTCSYVLVGTHTGEKETFSSTCHGAGRVLSSSGSRRKLDYDHVTSELADRGVSMRVASSKLIVEEAPESYKDVTAVVNTCHQAGISSKVVKMRPIAVVKG